MLSNRLAKHFGAAAAAAVVVGSANAAIVTWNVNQVVPNTIDGLYINVETQTTGSAAGVVAGWDLNPYGTQTTSMSWFGATGGGCVTGLGQGGTTIAVASLSSGTLVGASSTFSNNPASSVTAGGWVLNANNFFGFRFVGGDGQTRYGYGVMAIGANMGTRTLVSLAYESTAGQGINVGAVPAPGAIALLGLAGLAGRRRR
jgi:MYXO-CTERM domain-containing protein